MNQKLVQGRGGSVVEIQTPFGGGKTHSLVAIYHYLKHGAEIQELLPPGLDLRRPRMGVIAGNHWNPLEQTIKEVVRQIGARVVEEETR